MWTFGAFCDQFCVSTRLYFKLDLQPSRETVLHFMEQLRRSYPKMSRLRRREDGALLLDEEEASEGGRHVLRLDGQSLKFAVHDAESPAAVTRLAERVFGAAPAHLSLSDLDYDHLEVALNFDLEYRGNHDDLLAETFFSDHPLMRVLASESARTIECQPFFGVALRDDCEQQLYLELRGRTTTFELRSGEFEASPLTVSLIARRYWSPSAGDLISAHRELLASAAHIVEERVIPHVVQPLAAAIASRQQ